MKAPFPFVERPASNSDPFWRYPNNPVIGRNHGSLARVFNSALLPYGDGYIGVFRAEKRDSIPHLFLGRSLDGIHFEIEETPIRFTYEDGRKDDAAYGYDPRLIEMEGKYYILWCDDLNDSPAINIGYTEDFNHFVKMNHPFPPNSRNGVLFPEKFDGQYLALYRPTDGTDGNIYCCRSQDLHHWGDYSLFLPKTHFGWGKYKIGAGCNPIKTKEGWLLIYHGVIDTCNGLLYSIGGALLDLKDPTKVLYRCKDYLLTPEAPYETVGFVPNVCFPCSALVDEATGRIALYYGCADTVTSLAFSTIDILISYIKEHAEP